MTTTHDVSRDEVMAYVDGELSPARLVSVEAHLVGCEACRTLSEELRAVSARLQAWDVEGGPSAMPRAIRDAMAPPRSRWAFWPIGPVATGWPRWGLAAGSLAGVLLVVVMARPGGPFWSTTPMPVEESADARSSQVSSPPEVAGEVPETRERPESRPAAQESVAAAEQPVVGGRANQSAPGREVVKVAEAAPPVPPPPAAPVITTTRPLAAAPPPAAVAASAQQRIVVAPNERFASELAFARADPAVLLDLAGSSAGAPLDETVPAREVHLTLAVADVAAARAAVEELVRDVEGRQEAAAQLGVAADRRAATPDADDAVLRVPVGRLDAALEKLRAIGEVGDVERQDVDLRAELVEAARAVAVAEQTEEQLTTRRAAAAEDDIAGLDRALGLTREQLVTLRANLRLLRERQSLARIVIRFR